MDRHNFLSIFKGEPGQGGPHTLESPIRVDVWRHFALNGPEESCDLLLESDRDIDVKRFVRAIERDLRRTADLGSEGLAGRSSSWGRLIAVKVPFETFLRVVVPMTSWSYLMDIGRSLEIGELAEELSAALKDNRKPASYSPEVLPPGLGDQMSSVKARFRWFILLIVRIGYISKRPRPDYDDFPTSARSGSVKWLHGVLENTEHDLGLPASIASVSTNRAARVAVKASRRTVKADAVGNLFKVDASHIGWAVLDSGIDARHLAFRRLRLDGTAFDEPWSLHQRSNRSIYVNQTRVVRTYDFRGARRWTAGTDNLTEALLSAKVDLDDAYPPPVNEHGTHVAGILGADWREGADRIRMQGICPDVLLSDFRVLDDDGLGSEFDIIAALKAVMMVNGASSRRVIHGVNLSLSMRHEVENWACGWTPVCQAVNELVDSGVVVVAAAGNTGFLDPDLEGSSLGTGYSTVSITDPGNADKVITVGSTGRDMPYRYGASYFSSRGPTADGRPKPDLVAPGEGILGPVPGNDEASFDGTSQAAPHVSGVAALLLGRYPELQGDPMRVKQILCDTANDLGRDRYFQGAGVVDALRALGSV